MNDGWLVRMVSETSRWRTGIRSAVNTVWLACGVGPVSTKSAERTAVLVDYERKAVRLSDRQEREFAQ